MLGVPNASSDGVLHWLGGIRVGKALDSHISPAGIPLRIPRSCPCSYPPRSNEEQEAGQTLFAARLCQRLTGKYQQRIAYADAVRPGFVPGILPSAPAVFRPLGGLCCGSSSCPLDIFGKYLYLLQRYLKSSGPLGASPTMAKLGTPKFLQHRNSEGTVDPLL